jgi:S-adenosylmethionine uptake transporter
MTSTQRQQNPSLGIAFVLMGMTAITVNDMLVKLLSDGYPLHQIVFIRSAIGIFFSLLMVQFEGGWHILKTATPGLHILRCILIVIANMTFFCALAVLPLAEATAVFFLAPLMITLLGIPILGEKVGPLRLAAVAIGFVGVIIMTRPWESSDARAVHILIYALPAIGAMTYALNQVLTRKLGVSSKASAMAVFIQTGFILVSAVFWLVAGDGSLAPSPDSGSLYFLLRAWTWPDGSDVWLFIATGFNSAIVGYCISQAYRMADAATVAPFEYVGLPLAIFWGWLIWDELPSPVTFLGIVLILGAGLFVFLRERQKRQFVVSKKRIDRRY